ncbi:uncharacterized protein LOC135347852 isoform X3 [Halichondria panicea]|uniref:uncharacterized protein LOC135347852 isoform X2 n=1 Tax=Halichondria panicea TaxID=6063 RepID=UPI00312BB276
MSTLVSRFDDIVASTNVLCSGLEGEFAQFINQPINLRNRLLAENNELCALRTQTETNEVKLRHARSSFDYQMKKRLEAEENLKQYEKQFTIILELLGDNKLKSLTAAERRSLAFLKDSKGKMISAFSPAHSYLSESVTSSCLSPSDLSLDVTNADEDLQVSILRDGKRWKRRRTASVEQVDVRVTPPTKMRRSNSGNAVSLAKPTEEGVLEPTTDRRSTLSPEVNKIPPLDKHFKKPPPLKNRRTPSKQHLKQMAAGSGEDEEMDALEELLEEITDDLTTPPPSYEKVDLESVMVTPTAPPLYPVLPLAESPLPLGNDIGDSPASIVMAGFLSPTLVSPTPVASPSQLYKSHSDYNMQRPHTFFTKTMLKLETISCTVCHKKIKFSKNLLKCRDCRAICHEECKNKVPVPCIPNVPTPKKKQLLDALSSYCPNTVPRVPGLVVHCISAIESRGLATVGLYRVPGADKTVREVKERLLVAKGNPGLDKVSDVNVLCGVLKDFFIKLKEPLLTFKLHSTFIKATECTSDEDGLGATLEAIACLPPPNKDTLAFLILHLQRVAAQHQANKMPMVSLAKVFGPTIVGHATAKPEASVMWQDTQKQPKVMQRLLTISPDYWRQYLSPVDNPEPPVSPTLSAQSSPGVLNSPATPELRPVPESPFLGSCQSPRSRARPPHMARLGPTPVTNRTRRAGNFFAPLN